MQMRHVLYLSAITALILTYNNCSSAGGGGSELVPQDGSSAASDVELLLPAVESLAGQGWSTTADASKDLGLKVSPLTNGQYYMAHGDTLYRLKSDLSFDNSLASLGRISLTGGVRAMATHGSYLYLITNRYVNTNYDAIGMLERRRISDGEQDLSFTRDSVNSPGFINVAGSGNWGGSFPLTYMGLGFFSDGDILVAASADLGFTLQRIDSVTYQTVWSVLHKSSQFKIWLRDVRVLGDDRVLVSGFSQKKDWDLREDLSYSYAARYMGNGSLDATFATQGQLVPNTFNENALLPADHNYNNTPGHERETACCVFGDEVGKLYFVSTRLMPNGARGGILIARTDANGAPDLSFGEFGRRLIGPTHLQTEFLGIKKLITGKYLLWGSARKNHYYYSALYKEGFTLRLNEDWTIDTTYGTNGIEIFGNDSLSEEVSHVFEGPSGSLVEFARVFVARVGLNYTPIETSAYSLIRAK